MERLTKGLEALAQCGRLRTLRPLAQKSAHYKVDDAGSVFLNLTSNDYLGLAGDVQLHKAFLTGCVDGDLLNDGGLGGASSRLLTGDTFHHHRLEAALGAAYGHRSALLFNSGYHANIGILPALFDKGDLLLSDKRNHASLHDGLRLCGADYKRFHHGDLAQLETLLARYRAQYRRVAIISESLFSMDGDVADVARLVALKKQYDSWLYLDEAHAVGLYGPQGLGVAEACGRMSEVDLLVGTFGKALASVGAYVICDAQVRDWLINHSRSLIFTTALPPINVRWTHFVFQKMLTMGQERAHVADLGCRLRSALRENGLKTDGDSQIVPVLVGDDQRAVEAAKALQAQGYGVMPVRPPTVPPGTSRFRLSLTAPMRWEDLSGVSEAISKVLSLERLP